MSSWLGACMIAGCAIGATGIVIHHYSSSAYQIPPKITYMINEEEWVEGVVTEFNNKVLELVPNSQELATKEIDSYNKTEGKYKDKPHAYRAHCVTLMADAYRKEKENEVKEGIKKVFVVCPKVSRPASPINV